MLVAVEGSPAIALGPGVPGRGLDAMQGCAQRQHMEEQGLVVSPPVVREEAALGVPAQGDGRRSRLRPRPVDPRVDRVGEPADARLPGIVAVEVGLAEQYPGQEQRRVHGGELHPLEARAGLGIEEVVEESPVARDPRGGGILARAPEKPQGAEDTLGGLGARDVSTLGADRVGREREAHGSHADERGSGSAIGSEPGLGVAQVPEVTERPLLEGVEERHLPRGERGRISRQPLASGASWAARRGRCARRGCRQGRVCGRGTRPMRQRPRAQRQ